LISLKMLVDVGWRRQEVRMVGAEVAVDVGPLYFQVFVYPLALPVCLFCSFCFYSQRRS